VRAVFGTAASLLALAPQAHRGLEPAPEALARAAAVT